jgi:hypothetical protein
LKGADSSTEFGIEENGMATKFRDRASVFQDGGIFQSSAIPAIMAAA